MESTDHLKKGDKVKIQSKNRGALQHGHENYAGCVVTIDGIKTVDERVFIKEFGNDPDVGLDWIPIEFIKSKVSILPEHLFEID